MVEFTWVYKTSSQTYDEAECDMLGILRSGERCTSLSKIESHA